MAYIYKITNTQNGKIYIGKTLSTVEKRFKEHCRDSQREKYEKRPLYSAMKKYGVDAFKVETIEECSADESSEREMYWIEYYDSFHNGYNATIGGDGKRQVDYEKIYLLWQQGKTVKEISQTTGHDKNTVTNALEDKGITSEERKRRAITKVAKKVSQLDKDTNQILNIFESASDAAEQVLKDKTKHSHIIAVCKGKRQTAYGYKWAYVEDLEI